MMPKVSNIVVFVVASIFCLLGVELAFRAVSGVPVLSLTNWRTDRLVQSELRSASQYDAVVGWTMKDDLAAGDLNTIAYGIRKNRRTDHDVAQGGILVVGDSFAAGSQVTDEETWPAQVALLLERPVLNAAVGGYGIDQMLLRARQLFTALRPAIVILSTQDQGVLRVPYSSYGRPKPYFSVEEGRLVAHNSPVPRDFDKPKPHGVWKRILSYSYVADQIIGRYYPERWYVGDDQQFVKTDNDPVTVSCALLQEFKRDAGVLGFRPLFVMQYGGAQVATGEEPPFATPVVACARDAGLEVVDTFGALRSVADHGIDELKKYYIMSADGQTYGHMSPPGNRSVAEQVAEALAAVPPATAPPRQDATLHSEQ
jgi:hypothetical protein